MTKRRLFRKDERQRDLFEDARDLYPVETPKGAVTAFEFKARLAQAISQALKDCGKSRALVAAEMSVALAAPVSEHMLNAYASPVREEHDISVTRLRALVVATGQPWLLNVALEGLGVTLLAGADALYAQDGLIARQISELQARQRELRRTTPIVPATAKLRPGR